MEAKELINYFRDRGFIPEEAFKEIRKWGLRPCHDAILYMRDSNQIALTRRGEEPAKGFIWPFGGGHKFHPRNQNPSFKTSLRKVLSRESGLTRISNIQNLFPTGADPVPHFWSTGPEDHPYPVMDEASAYYAVVAEGEINTEGNDTRVLMSVGEYMERREELPHWTRVGVDHALNHWCGAKVIPDPESFPAFYTDGKPHFLPKENEERFTIPLHTLPESFLRTIRRKDPSAGCPDYEL